MRNNLITPIQITTVEFGMDGFNFIIESDNDNVYFIEVDMEYPNPSGFSTEWVNIDYNKPNEKTEDAEVLLARYVKKYIETVKYISIPKHFPKSINKRINERYFTFVCLMLSAKENSFGCLVFEGETSLRTFYNIS